MKKHVVYKKFLFESKDQQLYQSFLLLHYGNEFYQVFL